MTIGRLNGSKTVAIPASAENTQAAETPKSSTVRLAKDTYEETKPPNDITKALGQNTAQLKNIVQAGEAANPTLNPQGQSQERYGTSSNSFFNFPQDHDRFGFGNPEDTDLKQQLDQRTGLAFDPNRDLNIPDGGAFSSTLKDPLKGGGFRGDEGAVGRLGSDNSDTKSLQDENKSLKQENDYLRAMLAQQQMQRAMDQLDQQNAKMDQKTKEVDELVRKAVEAAKNPNPDAPDNSSGGPMNPLINNLGSPMKIRDPFVDPVDEQEFGPSDVMMGRDQAVDPNPDADPNIGAAQKSILSTSDAVTDPILGHE